MNEQFYNVSANPHVRDKASTHSIMLDVIIALLPATLFGFWNFGVTAIINTVICVAVCVLAEYVWQRCMHQKVTVKDGPELYEPCTWSTLFLINFFCGNYDRFLL